MNEKETPIKEAWVQFTASVNPNTIGRFLGIVTNQFNNGVKRFHILLSTGGGYVLHGLTAFNALRALPVEVITYNIGQVHSIGGTFFVAGEKRYAVPNSYFLVHSVALSFGKDSSFEEKLLQEKLASIQEDTRTIAGVLSDRIGLDSVKINEMMRKGVTIGTSEAKDIGLIHDILTPKIPEGVQIFSITDVT